MADVLLGTVIQNLGSFVREELSTFLGVEELTQKLCGNLTAIRAVLQDAEEKQLTSRVVKDWLQKLTDVAYVLDDILDDCTITSKAHGDNKWITRFHPKKILARRDIGKRMKEVAKKIDVIAEERIKFGLQAVVMEDRQRGDDKWRQTFSVITEPKVYGRDRDREQVVEFLLSHAVDSEELSVYSIVGVGGQGKTTLAQVVFNDERVDTHFNLKIWVCVSEDFSMMKVLQSIIESTDGKNPDLSSLESMQKKVKNILQNKRYLLVLDDVWNEDQEKWNQFKYFLQRGNGTKGASVLVTTRLDIVASIMGTYPAHHLLGLSDDAIWYLFKQKAFETNREERAELVAIGKELVRKCVGSPLAAKVLGSLLRFKTEEHQWLSVKESKFWSLSEDNPIMSVLRLSYFNLKLSLRLCFTFCAVFPKDFEMVKEELIHLWLANGFISSVGNLEVEHVGQEVWNELYARSFFQEVKTDKKGEVTFKMHDLIHDLAQSITGEECMAFDDKSLTNLSGRVHHISFSFINLYKPFNYNTIPFKKVESLRTFLEFYVKLGESAPLPSIPPLRALRTRSSQLSTLKSLTHLRYLEICKSWIKTLPESVCRLQNLQILKLVGCPLLSSLPKKLTQLQDLRHLVIKYCNSLDSMPSNISKLTCLKTLSTFIVESKAGFGLAQLHDLQLGGKLHIRGLENVSSEWDAKEANLIGKKELNRLYLSWGSHANSQGIDTDVERVLEALEPHTGLKGFGIEGYVGIHLPHWMRNASILEGLVDITFYNCNNCQRLPPLGKLPCLTTLYVCGIRDLKYIDDDIYESTSKRAFISLKNLTLCGLPNLERMLKAEGVEMLPQLSYFNITNVPKLALPSLPSIELLDVGEIKYRFSPQDIVVDLFPERIVCSMHNLKFLIIVNFHKLKVLPDDLHFLSVLEELHISRCDELESFSMYAFKGLISLRVLTIDECPELISLSEGMGDLASLERLVIQNCEQLVLPSNMNKLTSLRQVAISGYLANNRILEGLEVIPSLQNLTLSFFDYLPESLGAMTSLQRVEIIFCPNLKSLPNSFQNLINLHTLLIFRCSMLVKRCKKGTGKDWQKIAHVPELELIAEDTYYMRNWKEEDRDILRHRYQAIDIFFRNQFKFIVDAL
ncbi:putative P-loop containing nucleoside triphosphate hydrolase, leucine-rich repeat domain, L [Medicago truncatula]|uniref:NBS-LRR type disease resistance protein n=1 Tax=Medicago truncatula TaxID=3880 RepID=G7KLI9_MEDTR|nr:disease resistance protein RGA2 [Medicago truncatula]AES75658.2 NBS-LRR type disease resistance protein [Medicago truncatula]RHN51565.1 putative P-loop containing nucleoside triphosphate hydrolase, leucine-rich repeat domain, L [Medicago truncatula]